jgi:two-component system, NtrC family, sensor kinase
LKELKAQFGSALLIILTVAVVVAAGFNFQQQKKNSIPDDGVSWVDERGDRSEQAPGQPVKYRVVAAHVVPGGPAQNARLKQGDVLLAINGMTVNSAADVLREHLRLGVWREVKYLINRNGVQVEIKDIILVEATTPKARYFLYFVGFAYLAIGLFIYARRRRAPKSVHFYLLCLVSFVLSTFHYTGVLDNFDIAMYWGNVASGLLAPAIFLHFCLTFADRKRWFRGMRSLILYVPAIALLAAYWGAASGTLRVESPLMAVRWVLDSGWLLLLSITYLAGAAVLTWQYRRADEAVVRHQLKWLRNGAVFGSLPFTVFYVVPFLAGIPMQPWMEWTVLSLAIIPLSWAYAILRYRLMDVDIIFQQGFVYTLATLAVLGIVYGMVVSVGKAGELSMTAVVVLVVTAAFVFQPIRNWLQEQFDRYVFYKDRYDYRRTLISFARELSSEIDRDHMLTMVGERLIETLSIQHVSFFIEQEDWPGFSMKLSLGRRDGDWWKNTAGKLDLGYLNRPGTTPYLFFERTRHMLDAVSMEMPASERRAIADLDLTYYFRCVFRGQTIAWLGVSRTDKDDFLSSDDIDLLVTISNYIAIALENVRLYQSLQDKVDEFERLKEFSENIVESINVGILAADLDDRVESWNNQIERMTGIPREYAVGRRLVELFPADLVLQFTRTRGEIGVHNSYKQILRKSELPMAVERGGNGHNGGGNGNGNGDELAIQADDEVTMNIAIAPLVSKEGQQIGRLIIFDDVTERADLERRLVQADKLSSIGLLAAGVAHEVNTPLAVISTYAQMLGKQVSGDEVKAKLLEKIARQTFRASEIVNSLLNFSRTSPTDYVDVDVNRVIRETLSLVEHQFKKANVRAELDLVEDLPPVRGNFGRLQQVFLNLFLNARDAMDGDGVLTVNSGYDDDRVRLTISDTGHGISPEHVAKIFDPFFTTKSMKKGTGLGLSVTYGIVQEHSGSIEVQSTPGVGTQFHLDFPLARKLVNA